MTNFLGLTGQFFTFSLGLLALSNSKLLLSLCLFASAIFFLAAHLIIQRGGSRIIAFRCIIYNFMLLIIYLVYSGGVDQTGPLWIFLIPPATLFFPELKKRVIEILIFTILLTILLFYDGGSLLATEYNENFKVRLITIFLALTFLSAYYEHSRIILYNHITAMQEVAEVQAKQDSLTNLLNRRGIMEMINHEYQRLDRHEVPLSILLCDIDYFKKVNDTCGHQQGDIVLQKLSRIFLKTIRKQDMVARWGGEEFLIMLPDASATDALRVAEKLRKKVAATNLQVPDHSIQVTVSIGVSEVTRQHSIDYAISKADEYLYQAKSLGRNRVAPGSGIA